VLPFVIVHRSGTHPVTFMQKRTRWVTVAHLTSTMLRSTLILSCIVVVSCLAPPGDWDRFNFAPSSRVVTPTAVHSSDGQIMNPSGLIGAQGNTIFSSSGSWLALDFGVEVRCFFSSGLDRD